MGTFQTSDAVANAKLNAYETTVGTSPILRLRNGTMPANCAAARSGTILATINLPSDWLGNASSRTKVKTGTWEDPSADASGYATQWELMDSSGTTCHFQGLVSQPWVPNTAWASGQQCHINGLVFRCTTPGTSASSGGPSGTGTGITDGTVVWAYAGPESMTMTNTNIATTQQVTVSAFDFTAAN